MIDLQLREEFRGKRLKGTTVDFTNQSKTGALDVPAAEFLKITYPSVDLLMPSKPTAPNNRGRWFCSVIGGKVSRTCSRPFITSA